MIGYSVNVKAAQAFAYLQDVPGAVRSATQAAINSMSPDVREEAARGISSVYNITPRIAKRGVKLWARASPNKLRAIWRPYGKPILLTQFSPKASSKRRSGPGAHPVSVEVLRGKRQTVRGAFIGPNRDPSARVGAARIPTRRLWGPGIPSMFAREEVNKAMVTMTDRVLPGRIESEMVRQLRKLETGRLPPVR